MYSTTAPVWLLMLLAPPAQDAPVQGSDHASSVAKKCEVARKSDTPMKPAENNTEYPDSYYEGERLAGQIRTMSDCLSDQTVSGSYGASGMWKHIDRTGQSKKKPSAVSGSKPRIKPKD